GVTIGQQSAAIGASRLSGGQPVERVVSEALTSVGIFEISDAPDVAVVGSAGAVSYVEVVANREHSLLTGRGGRNVDRLKLRIVAERVDNSRKAAALPIEETSRRVAWIISRSGNIINVVTEIDCRDYPAN